MRRVLLILALLAPASVAHGQTTKVTYDDHVLPMLREKCLTCHGQDKKSGGLSMHLYTKLMEGGSSGVIVKAGDPDASPLFNVVAHKAEPFMPPRSPMLAKEADLLRRWIEGGALENSGSKAVATKPRVDIGLASVVRGKPQGPPPMPEKPLSLEPVVHSARPNAVIALASSPWAPLVAIAGAKQVLLYHSDTLELLGVLPFPEGQIQVLKFSRNASLLLAAGGRGGKSGKAVLWSVKTGQRIAEIGDETDSVLAADISPDQSTVAIGGPGKILRIYATADGKLLHEIRKHTDWITTLEFSPDGVLLATGDRSGGLQVWEAYTAREYFSLRGHTGAITEVSWRPDGNLLASASEDTTIRLWEMENGGQVRTWGAHGGGCLSVNFGKDGQLVSAGRDRVVKLWDGNGGLKRQFDALPDVALRSSFTHDGARILAGDWSGQVPVWQTSDGKRLGQLTPNPAPVAERLEIATKELAAAKASHDKLAANVTTAQAAVTTATAELARLQKVAAESAAGVKTATDQLAKAKAVADQAKAALTAALGEVRSREVLVQVWQEAAAKVKEAAARAKGDKALAAAAARANDLATSIVQELAQARKVVEEKTKSNQVAEAALPPLQQAVTTATATATNAPKMVEAQATALKGAQANLAAAQAALAPATAAVTQSQAALDRLKAVVSNTTKAASK